jgi:hypothetical protein
MNWVYLRGHHRITPGQSRDKKLKEKPLKDNRERHYGKTVKDWDYYPRRRRKPTRVQ